MNFKVFRFYIQVCDLAGLIPSWKGLEKFRVFYLWECENSVRCYMD